MGQKALAVIRRWVGNSQHWVADFLLAAPKNSSIVAIVAMGSAVRDRGHRRSDLDLLLIFRARKPAIKAPMEVDIRFLDFNVMEKQVASGDEVVCWAVRFGKPLYDPEHAWKNLVSSWSQRVPLPSAQEARERGKNALARASDMLLIGDESAADDLILSALTQFVRERLIENCIFPASRPELPDQLRAISPYDHLAQLLEDAMYKELGPHDLMRRLKDTVSAGTN